MAFGPQRSSVIAIINVRWMSDYHSSVRKDTDGIEWVSDREFLTAGDNIHTHKQMIVMGVRVLQHTVHKKDTYARQ